MVVKEREELKQSRDTEELAADVEALSVFGELNVIDSLANGDVTKYEAVLKVQYITCFLKMKLNVAQAEYRKRLKKVYDSKHKVKQ